ncbi:MAG TPA: ABC transporter ATP-binding protein [Candidatus Krumholzibacteria bacterium]|nr:ABC transporter ATP-binding protein [Candidatus Krumholzibacteria bacterium]
MSEQQPIVRLRGVSKHYGATRALNDVSLDIMPGTIVGVLGPNGSGKTTLMGHLPGLLVPTAGTVETFGQPAARLDDAALARIGYVSQEPRLMDWLTVEESIDFVRAGQPAWDEGLAARLQADFELDGGKRVAALSPGLRQRLAILLAVAPQPELLLLDEPAASLDPVARHDFLQLLMELIQDGRRTILISSHVLADVEKVVDTVLVINKGQVHCHQPLDELRESYHRVDIEAVGADLPDPLPLPGLLTVTGDRRRAMAVCGHVARRDVEAAARALGAEARVRGLAFEEIYRLIATSDGRKV